jgi:L-galactose dehydrogenase/L-glyceraldehyde 3-phosphate reductase
MPSDTAEHVMNHRPLGATGINVSAIAFGAGPVPELMTGDDPDQQQRAVARAIDLGINWFDTAPGYGNGQSEKSLGAALAALGHPRQVHLATKVRLLAEDLNDIGGAVERSITASLARLKCQRLTLVQIHNAIAWRRGDEPNSITPQDVLGSGGLLPALARLQRDLREVIDSGALATMQRPYHLLNPSAGRPMPAGFGETNFGNLISHCHERGVGVLAIRVFAGGALLHQAPSRHTHRTPYFPLPLYQRDLQHAARIGGALNGHLSLKEAALRFALSHRGVAAAIVGFGTVGHVEEAVAIAAAGPLSAKELSRLDSLVHTHEAQV